MPNALSFVDTNILVYRAGLKNDPKTEIATKLLNAVEFGLSTQVLQEFYVTATHPKKLQLTHESALELIEPLLEFPIHVVDLWTIREALELKVKFRISYWDAVIVVSARALGCKILYTEDLKDRQNYDGVEAINPFTPQFRLIERSKQ
ncbi:MAG: hypothetical protein JWM99_3971 [Verrucomicrobiales bacterium]|nr:hypothetical protein [Verrucomicrobiales bacterium]